MIRSVAHVQTSAWNRTHRLRHRRGLIIILCIILAALLLWGSGYFTGVEWTALLGAVFYTTYRLVIAYLVALALGATIALLVGWSPFVDALFPVFDILQNIPSFALIPFFIYFFGFTDLMVILFGVSTIIWPILFAVLGAIKSAHTDLSDAATIFGARGWRRVPHYLAPLSLPAILTGSIVGIAAGWDSIIGAEIITSISGFGAFIKDASVTGINQVAVAGILVILVFVFIINRLVWTPLLSESSRHYAE
jgi:ABC-type nitrate/sulfonate/bicarbonate transport system permease component